MAIQTMGLDYSWLVDLAKLIAQARQQPTGGIKGATGLGAPSTSTSMQPSGVALESPEEVAYYERKRTEKAAEAVPEHEVAMQKLVNEGALAQAISQERGGTEQAKIAAAGQVAAAQKTTADKAKETIDLLLQMTPEGQKEFMNNLKAKRTENQGGIPSGGTITSGGKTITTPGTSKSVDPNDPLGWIEETYGVDAETVIANLQPKTVAEGAQKTAANLLDDFQKIVIKGDLNTMLMLLTGEQGATQVLDALQQFGESNGYAQDVIDDVKATISGLAPTVAPTGGEENVAPEKVVILDTLKGLVGQVAGGKKGEIGEETVGKVAPFIHAALHPKEVSQWSPEYATLAGQWKESAAKQPEAGKSDFIDTITNFLETAFKGPSGGGGGAATALTAKKKVGQQVGPTVNDAIADMKTWDTKTIKAFQKKVGIKEDGKMSQGLIDAMKVYFEKHKDEWR
jgi:hypothetical protein